VSLQGGASYLAWNETCPPSVDGGLFLARGIARFPLRNSDARFLRATVRQSLSELSTIANAETIDRREFVADEHLDDVGLVRTRVSPQSHTMKIATSPRAAPEVSR
jgi:hypothetical protein